MDLQLDGKVAIVTGGSRGIGKAIATALARERVDVTLVARDRDALATAAKDVARESGREPRIFAADTGSDAAIKAMVDDCIAATGRVDILVNCAATPGSQGRPPALSEITDENFFADMNIKVLGYIRTARECAPHMIRNGGGRIINISGTAARQTGTIIGSMRNISVAAMTKNIADELGAHGITAVCVHPGTTRTEKTPGVVSRMAQAQEITFEEAEKRMAANSVIGRIVGMEEVADIVTFLASPRATAINGESIAAGGGIPRAIYY